MNLPEWTGELWQWMLVLIYGGGGLVFVVLFSLALFRRDVNLGGKQKRVYEWPDPSRED